MRRIVLAYDHGGFELARKIKDWLGDVVDVGLPEFSDVSDFPSFAKAGVKEILKNGGVGIFVCGSGIGISMAANRHKGIRAALCHSSEYAKMSRLHNDANVLCLSGRFVDDALNKNICEAFLSTDFEAGRHARRVAKLEQC